MVDIAKSETDKEIQVLTDVDPKIDPAFKAVVAEKKLLLGFLRDLFDYLQLTEPIDLTYEDNLTYENVELEGAGYYGKTGRLDLCVELKGHSKISVEMQIRDKLDMPHRLQFYASKIFTNQFKRGMSHADDVILPTLVIGILAFNLRDIKDGKMIHSFKYHDALNNIELPDNKTNIVTIELPKLDNYFVERGKKSGIGYWSAFFRHKEEDKTFTKEYRLTMEAEQVLERKRHDDSFIKAYKQAKDILDDEESQLKTYSYNRYKLGVKEGEEKGRAEHQKEMIQKLKVKGKSLEEIADLLDLPFDEIKINSKH